MSNSAPSVRSRRRRSPRFKLKVPVTIQLLGGSALAGETTSISKHGARIQVRGEGQPLSCGDQVQVTVRARREALSARIVWVDGSSASAFAIELQEDGDAWGIHFPSRNEEWRPSPKPAPALSSAEEVVAPAPLPAALTPPVPEPPSSIVKHPPLAPISPAPQQPARKEGDPTSTLTATISGMSAVHTPMLESAEVVFTGTKEAIILLRNLVDPGTLLRLMLAGDRIVKGRVVSVGRKQEAGKWRVRLKCDKPSS